MGLGKGGLLWTKAIWSQLVSQISGGNGSLMIGKKMKETHAMTCQVIQALTQLYNGSFNSRSLTNLLTIPKKSQRIARCQNTVDGRNPANQLRLVVYPIMYSSLYIPGGCLGFLNHQQYVWFLVSFSSYNAGHFERKTIRKSENGTVFLMGKTVTKSITLLVDQWFCPQGPWYLTPNFSKSPTKKGIPS